MIGFRSMGSLHVAHSRLCKSFYLLLWNEQAVMHPVRMAEAYCE